MLGLQVLTAIEGIIETADDGLFNFGAAEIGAGFGQGFEIEPTRIPSTLSQMDSKNLLAFFKAE